MKKMRERDFKNKINKNCNINIQKKKTNIRVTRFFKTLHVTKIRNFCKHIFFA